MRLLTPEKICLLVESLEQKLQQLNLVKPENSLQALELLENLFTLSEIKACLSHSEPLEINRKFISVLSARWERIRNTNMCYTKQPGNMVNQLCLDFATEIAPPASTTALEPNTGPYFLLMPSLEHDTDMYLSNIHDFGLHEFVLSDHERVFIPIAQCLNLAFVSDEGKLRQLVSTDDTYPVLSLGEIERLSHHSKQALEYYQAVINYNKERLFDDNIGSKLTQLVVALRNGGAHGRGAELNAGSHANLGILAFSEYWNALSAEQRTAFFTETPELEALLGRLFRPEHENYRETRYCVELIANGLDPIIAKYNQRPGSQELKACVLTQKTCSKKH